ncbi:MAG: DUF6226 family protein [Microbacteriaceae bacterium]
MFSYCRPRIEPVVFRDAEGDVIEYGGRWRAEPPTDSYSVTSNLERFRPLHAVADALIAALILDQDVIVEDDVDMASDLMHHRDDVVRAVRLSPIDSAAAPLTFVFTSFPSVLIHAGLMHDFFYPICGCDACDESWERMADSMEWDVAAIVAGGYSESADRASVSFRLVGENGTRSGSGRGEDAPADRLAAAEPRLVALDGWSAWPDAAAASVTPPGP